MQIDERFFRLRDRGLQLVCMARREGLVVPEDLRPFVDEWIECGNLAAADRADLMDIAHGLYEETVYLPDCVFY